MSARGSNHFPAPAIVPLVAQLHDFIPVERDHTAAAFRLRGRAGNSLGINLRFCICRTIEHALSKRFLSGLRQGKIGQDIGQIGQGCDIVANGAGRQ